MAVQKVKAISIKQTAPKVNQDQGYQLLSIYNQLIPRYLGNSIYATNKQWLEYIVWPRVIGDRLKFCLSFQASFQSTPISYYLYIFHVFFTLAESLKSGKILTWKASLLYIPHCHPSVLCWDNLFEIMIHISVAGALHSTWRITMVPLRQHIFHHHHRSQLTPLTSTLQALIFVSTSSKYSSRTHKHCHKISFKSFLCCYYFFCHYVLQNAVFVCNWGVFWVSREKWHIFFCIKIGVYIFLHSQVRQDFHY